MLHRPGARPVGNVSAATAWSCATVPLDDRSMSSGAGALRLTADGALGRTVVVDSAGTAPALIDAVAVLR